MFTNADHEALDRFAKQMGNSPPSYATQGMGTQRRPKRRVSLPRVLFEVSREGIAIETWRDGELSVPGIVGGCAKLTVPEEPGLHLAKYQPFPAARPGSISAVAAETGA